LCLQITIHQSPDQEDAFAVNVHMFLLDEALVAMKESKLYIHSHVPIWSAGYTSCATREDGLKKIEIGIEQLADLFIKDYYKTNPKK